MCGYTWGPSVQHNTLKQTIYNARDVSEVKLWQQNVNQTQHTTAEQIIQQFARVCNVWPGSKQIQNLTVFNKSKNLSSTDNNLSTS